MDRPAQRAYSCDLHCVTSSYDDDSFSQPKVASKRREGYVRAGSLRMSRDFHSSITPVDAGIPSQVEALDSDALKWQTNAFFNGAPTW